MSEPREQEDSQIPDGYEAVGILNLANGGMDILIAIERPDEWQEEYPEALREAREDAASAIDELFEDTIRLSEYRRREAEKARGAAAADAAEVPAPTASRRAASRSDSLTLTVEEAGEQLGISRALAYEAVRRGEIPSIKIGRRILIPKAALHRLLDSANQM